MRCLLNHILNKMKSLPHISAFLAPPLLSLTLAALPNSAFSQTSTDANRAVVKEFTAELALPNGDPLFVGMKLDCNSRFSEAGMIIFSDQQVETLARAYEVLYGLEIADHLRQIWQTKQTPDSPRLPTFIIVLDTFNQEPNQATNQFTHQTDYQNSNGFANERQKEYVQHRQNSESPIFFSSCGHNLHPPE